MAYAINFLCEAGWDRREQSETRDKYISGNANDRHQMKLATLWRRLNPEL